MEQPEWLYTDDKNDAEDDSAGWLMPQPDNIYKYTPNYPSVINDVTRSTGLHIVDFIGISLPHFTHVPQ